MFRRIIVKFDVPSRVKAGLETGKYIRKGGVIVQGTGRPSVVHWLQEGNRELCAFRPDIEVLLYLAAPGPFCLDRTQDRHIEIPELPTTVHKTCFG